MILTNLTKYRDQGLLILRIGIGIMFILHGYSKVFDGPERWEKLGGNMADLGIDFALKFWGFMAGMAEFGGGILLMLGLFFRPACILMFITMFVAASHHWIEAAEAGENLKGKIMEGSHAIEAGILFLTLIFIGPGRFSLDERIRNPKNSNTLD